MNVVHENLIKARALIEAGWTQHSYARQVDEDHPIDLLSPGATCFCAMGALYRVVGDVGCQESSVRAEIEALGFPEETHVLLWNDQPGRTKEQVLAKFDEGIERIKPC